LLYQPTHTGVINYHTAKFSNVDAFLKKQNPKWNQDDNKPWLFYNSDWQEETELYFDSKGDAIDTDGDVIVDDDPNPPQANVRDWDPPNLAQMGPSDQEFFSDMKVRKALYSQLKV
jgi:hypothetical protein